MTKENEADIATPTLCMVDESGVCLAKGLVEPPLVTRKPYIQNQSCDHIFRKRSSFHGVCDGRNHIEKVVSKLDPKKQIFTNSN
jgi:hypothetical protein